MQGATLGAVLFCKETVLHIRVAVAACSVTFWLQASGMAEANTQRDSDDEWLEELLGQPGSSLTRHQTATAAVSRVEAVAPAKYVLLWRSCKQSVFRKSL